MTPIELKHKLASTGLHDQSKTCSIIFHCEENAETASNLANELYFKMQKHFSQLRKKSADIDQIFKLIDTCIWLYFKTYMVSVDIHIMQLGSICPICQRRQTHLEEYPLLIYIILT